jgi:hypothetical protein
MRTPNAPNSATIVKGIGKHPRALLAFEHSGQGKWPARSVLTSQKHGSAISLSAVPKCSLYKQLLGGPPKKLATVKNLFSMLATVWRQFVRRREK